jgi:hypothetical protein
VMCRSIARQQANKHAIVKTEEATDVFSMGLPRDYRSIPVVNRKENEIGESPRPSGKKCSAEELL